MSVHADTRRLTVPQIAARKGEAPIVCLTAYDTGMAGRVDAHADVILVGDSLGMVVHGMDSTIGVTLDMMILHGRAVMRGSRRALVVVDLPFGSYEESPETAYRTAARVLAETGATAVKLEGGARMAPTIRFLTERGVPVMAHVGLTPQSTLMLGGFKTQGRSEESWPAHMADIRAVAEAGAFCVVIEGVVEPLARQMTEAIAIPTIGIGASAACDGQVLVIDDMLGLTARVPRFVRKFGTLGEGMDAAIAAYAQAVRDRSFPGDAEVYR